MAQKQKSMCSSDSGVSVISLCVIFTKYCLIISIIVRVSFHLSHFMNVYIYQDVIFIWLNNVTLCFKMVALAAHLACLKNVWLSMRWKINCSIISWFAISLGCNYFREVWIVNVNSVYQFVSEACAFHCDLYTCNWQMKWSDLFTNSYWYIHVHIEHTEKPDCIWPATENSL